MNAHYPMGSFPEHVHTSGSGQPALRRVAFKAQRRQFSPDYWAPAVDIYETENELVLKADLPDVNEKDLDIRVENNMLTIRGERKFEQKVKEENYLRDRADLRIIQPQLCSAEHREHREHQGGIQERRADRGTAEAR